MVRFVLSLFWFVVLVLFVSAAVTVPQLQGTSVSFHIWPHLNLDTNLNSNNPAVSSYFVLLLLQWYQLLTRRGVWIASHAPPATSSLHWSKSVFIFWTVCPQGRIPVWGSLSEVQPTFSLWDQMLVTPLISELKGSWDTASSLIYFYFINLFCKKVGKRRTHSAVQREGSLVTWVTACTEITVASMSS